MLKFVIPRCIRQLHTSSACQAGSAWRIKQGLSKHPEKFNAMSELPDWSYLDGTPGPETLTQREEREEIEEFTRKAVQLMAEMKDARRLHEERGIQEKEKRQKLLDEKLKPKDSAEQYARIKYKNYRL